MSGNTASSLKVLRLSAGIVVAAALVGLAACGGGSNATNGVDSATTAFNTSFDKSLHDSCVTSASGKVTADAAEKYCSCLVAKIEPLTMQQKIGLNPNSPEMQADEKECAQQAGVTTSH